MGVVLRGADVLDGTGTAARRLDVAIEGDRIVGVGPNLDCDLPEQDLSGLVLSPGFIDPHTHYDAQILWDKDLTPSSWYGVTSVVMGNCGFTIAPTRAEHRDTIVHTMENVEGMSPTTLKAGIEWSFETFPEYLDTIETLDKRINVACLIGHTPLRWFVLGDEATERAATETEIDRMASMVNEAVRHGAVGFSTSLSEHVGAFGKPVPSRSATREELFRIASAMGETGTGTVEMVIGDDFTIGDVRRMRQISGRPVTWSGRVILPTEPEDSGAVSAAVDQSTAALSGIYPQFACLPIVSQVTLREPGPLKAVSAGIREIMGVPQDERMALCASPEWRSRVRGGLNPKWERRLSEAIIQETEVHGDLRNGPTLGELAARRGTTPIDLMIDLSLQEDLRTRFRIATTNTLEDVVQEMLGDPRCFLGLSDAGAHVTQICDGQYALHLLGYWVRERQAIPLETAVWRLTGHPAEVYGLRDRGRIAAGCAADLVAFDASRIGTTLPERVWDFPDRTDRLVAQGTGIEHVWVNGVPIREGGVEKPGVTPGRRLRSFAA